MKMIGILAMNPQGVIGKDNQLPWHCPNDLKWFQAQTHRCIVIMGRKTYESIGKPLPNRYSIVISSTMNEIDLPNVAVVNSVEDAVVAAKQLSVQAGFRNDRCFVMGGASIYWAMASYITEWLVTEVHVHYHDPKSMVTIDPDDLFGENPHRSFIMADIPKDPDGTEMGTTYWNITARKDDNKPK